MNLYRIDPICYVLYFSILQIRRLWVIQIKSFSKVTHLVDEAVRIWFCQSKIYFPPVQYSLSDPEDSLWPSIVGNSLSARPSDSVWSLNHTLQLAPPLSLSKIKFMSLRVMVRLNCISPWEFWEVAAATRGLIAWGLFINFLRFIYYVYVFTSFWQCWVIIAVHGLSPVVITGYALVVVLELLTAVASPVVEHGR